MKQLRCIIIDDEPLARNGLAKYCEEISFLEVVALCKNALQANDILHNEEIDLVFLDINMPLLSGIDWLKTLKKSPLIIMTTAYTEYALESFAYEVIDYLVKPISFDRFLQGVNKAYRLTANTTNEVAFFVKSDKVLKKVIVNDILYLEAMQNYVRIVTSSEEIITHTTLKLLREHLPETAFIQTHKSYVVSKDKVDAVDGNRIQLGNYYVPISVRMKKEVIAQLM